ncbi:MAG: EthD family reductase [Sphingosinicella sp.]|nr:EthD family reductase [Sphingosinicella sp.]
MTIVSIAYARSEGATFDYDYYEKTHLPLVMRRWRDAGVSGAEAMRGVSTLDGKEAAFFAVALIRFESFDRFREAFAGEHAAEIVGDIANFTNVRPSIQVNEKIGR